jgi:hypothetical protein
MLESGMGKGRGNNFFWKHLLSRRNNKKEKKYKKVIIMKMRCILGNPEEPKRSLSNEGLERFNALMVDVYWDRKENGTNFDIIFQEEMNNRYTKQQNEEPNPGGQEHEQMPHVSRVVQVYSDFNIEQLVAHVDASDTSAGGVVLVAHVDASDTSAGGVVSRQQQDHDDDHDADEETSTVPV